jgi:uncharacterized protein (UPF0332 family)
MNKDFEKCLKKKRILKQAYVKNLVEDELKAAKGDLERAKKTFADSDYKWATIQAYYSIFHAARALLYAKGYREKSHFCLKVAIQALYVDEGTLDKKYVDDFDTTMLLRETADYKSNFSKEGAESSIKSAQDFLAKAEEILQPK